MPGKQDKYAGFMTRSLNESTKFPISSVIFLKIVKTFEFESKIDLFPSY